MIYVPPAFAADSIMEAAAAGIEVIVCITEGIPVLCQSAFKFDHPSASNFDQGNDMDFTLISYAV